MSVDLEFKSARAALKLLRKDLNQILNVGTALRGGDRGFVATFNSMYPVVHSLKADYMTKFDTTQTSAIIGGNETLFPTEEDIKERNEVNFIFYKIIEIHQSEKTVAATPQAESSAMTVLNQSLNKTRLPRIDLPKFNGKLQEWPKFKQLFLSVVDTNSELSTIEKFHYLSTSLQGDPLSLIAVFSLCEDNYIKAWQALIDRYDNKRLLASSYISQVFDFPPHKGPPTLQSLQSFVRTVAENIDALRSIKMPNQADFLCLSLALTKLDHETKHAFELSVVSTEWPTFQQLTEFIQGRCKVLQLSVPSSSERSKPTYASRQSYKPNVLTTTISPSPVSNSQICSCNQSHQLFGCPIFRDKSQAQRRSFVLRNRVCFNCLRQGHIATSCSSSNRCRVCSRQHHTLLHQDSKDSQPPSVASGSGVSPGQEASSTEEKRRTNSESPSLVASVTGPAQVLLGTAVCHIHDSENALQPIRCLIDCGSQFSLMTARCARKLGLTWQATKYAPLGAGSVPLPRIKGQLKCRLFSRIKTEEFLDVEPLIVGNITGELPVAPLRPFHGSTQQCLADPLFWQPQEIDMLLGSDSFMKIITGSPTNLDAQYGALPTLFGLIVMGGNNSNLDLSSTLCCHCLIEPPLNEELLSQFWCIENVEDTACLAKTDLCEEHFLNTHCRDSSGRYVVSLPFKEPPEDLCESEALALSRFRAIENRFKHNSILKNKYADFMQEYEDLGHMSKTSSPSAYVIPHHPVFRSEDPEAKIRVVFDASAMTSRGSLNNKLHIGPKLQHDIGDIIINFRRYEVAITADLVKMYRQILVTPEHRRFQHILWRTRPNDNIQKYELNTVTYGMASAPFLANRVIKQLCIDEGSAFPLAARILNNEIYVDDVVTGANSLREAMEIVKQLTALLEKGQFNIHKWNSNYPELVRQLGPYVDRKSVELSPVNNPDVAKILGMSWDPVNDCLSYSVKTVSMIVTKRSILSTIARLYDPLGLLAPVLFKAKYFLQCLWKLRITWDEPIDDHLTQEWLDFATKLKCLERIRIPRYALLEAITGKQLIGFCDASQKGFAAAVYLRIVTYNHDVKVTLLKAKTKLAPIKTISIPRLELCGAQLLTKLMRSIEKFADELGITQRFHFTDSTIVLAWLRISPQSLPTFVANRVSYITTHTSENEWFHVPSHENPADLASRGLAPNLIKDEGLWWAGPPWLQEQPLLVPQQPDIYKDQIPEIKPGVILTLKSNPPLLIEWIYHHSSYKRIVRSLAYMLRFIHNIRYAERKLSGPLSLTEINQATELFIITTQRYEFKEEFLWEKNRPKSKRLLILGAYLDEKGVMRVEGRLQNSELPEETKSPIILPGKCHLMTLMIDHLHMIHFHLGQQALQAHIRRRFWVFRLRQVVKSRIHKCMPCVRLKARPSNPIMGNLPANRVRPSRPFTFVGVDYGGPFLIKQGNRRNSPISKAYLAVFVCMATKALHLEIVTSLSTDAFLATLDRFVARRGLPATIYSDCGTNFIGAARQLKELHQHLNLDDAQRTIHDHVVSKGIEWCFNPPYTPHMGGLWEAAVKSAKSHLHRIVKDKVFHLEELITLFTRIEAILNSRPITRLNDGDAEGGNFLTPGHFLIGAPLLSVPEKDLTEHKLNQLSRWQLVSQAVQHFWKRWHVEYLHTLQGRSKWYRPNKSMEVDDIVLLPDTNSTPLNWKLARIIKVHPGEDGVVRVVTVKDKTGSHRRSVHKLVSLPHLQEPENSTCSL